jgi:hypothetical protein
MSDYNTSPNMSMPVPIPSVTSGPAWATYEISCFGILDGHTHAAGSGVPITPSAMNINASLTFNSLYSATNLLTTNYTSQSAALSTGTYPIAMYSVGGELYWNDNASHQVKITNAGNVNASSSGINDGTSQAVFDVNHNLTVNKISGGAAVPIDTAGHIIRYPGSIPSPSGSGVLLLAPSAIAAIVPFTFPAVAAAASNSFIVSNTSGQLSYVVPDNTTMVVAAGTLSVGTIAAGNIGSQAVTQVKLAARATGTTVAAGGVAVSNSSGSYLASSYPSGTQVPSFSATITTTGRPVFLTLMGDPASSNAGFGFQSITTSSFAGGSLQFYRDATPIGGTLLSVNVDNNTVIRAVTYPPGSFNQLDMVAAGTYTYTLYYTSGNAAINFYLKNCTLVAYEI